jgi:MFS family permease
LVFTVKPEAIQILSNAGVFGPVVIVPLILQKELHASNEMIGLIAGGFAAAGFISSYIFGRGSDVYGRRNILLAGLFLSGVATLLQAVTIVSGGLAVFAGARILMGFCSGMFPAALLAYAYDTKGKMGAFSAWGALGWAFGNYIVTVFVAYEQAYLLCAIILFASFAIALNLPFKTDTRMQVPMFPKALIRRNAPVYASMLIRHTGANMIWVTYPLFLTGIGATPQWIGIIYGVNSVGQFIFMMFLMDKYDPSLLVAVGLGSSAVTFFTFTLAGSYWEIIPSQVMLAFAWASLYVGSLRYVMDKNKEKATASGLLSSTMSISGMVGPVMGGIAATAFDFKGTIAIATGMSIVALAIFIYDLKRSGEFYRLKLPSRGAR